MPLCFEVSDVVQSPDLYHPTLQIYALMKPNLGDICAKIATSPSGGLAAKKLKLKPRGSSWNRWGVWPIIK